VCHLIFFLYEQLVFFTDVVMILFLQLLLLMSILIQKWCFFASIYAVCFLYDWNHNISDLMHNSESVWISVMVKTM